MAERDGYKRSLIVISRLTPSKGVEFKSSNLKLEKNWQQGNINTYKYYIKEPRSGKKVYFKLYIKNHPRKNA